MGGERDVSVAAIVGWLVTDDGRDVRVVVGVVKCEVLAVVMAIVRLGVVRLVVVSGLGGCPTGKMEPNGCNQKNLNSNLCQK